MRVLIVGAGFAGAVYARSLAEAGHAITVIDGRPHIAGNAYDYVDETGVRVHRYGPHLFHTNNEAVVRWIRQFGDFVPYEHSVTVAHDGKFLPMPISRATFEAHYDRKFASEADFLAFLRGIAIPDENPQNAAAYLNSRIGPELTDLLFRRYTKKMWARDLEEMDAAVVRRVSINPGYEFRYFPGDKFQIMPRHGYTAIFEKILAHDNIALRLSTFYDAAMRRDFDHVFTSAAIDEHYGYVHGELPYRSLRFHHHRIAPVPGIPTATVNYADTGPYTRETHWHMLPCHHLRDTGLVLKTVEEPCDFHDNNRERYYPVKDAAGLYKARYEQYRLLAEAERDLTFIGRCGTYQYLDMHQVINQSLAGARQWLTRAA